MLSLADHLVEILAANQRPAPIRWLAREAQAPEGAVHAALKKDERFLGLPEGLWTTREFGNEVARRIALAFGESPFGPRDLRTVLGLDRKDVMPLLDWLQAKRWAAKIDGGFQWIGPLDLPELRTDGEESP